MTGMDGMGKSVGKERRREAEKVKDDDLQFQQELASCAVAAADAAASGDVVRRADRD